MDTEIPKEEFEAFRKLIRTYKKGEKIVIEGQQDTLGLLLLRKGDVEVYKELGTQRELISTLSAINFFGEISLIENRPRSATVEAASDEVTVYSFQSPDLQVLLSNPKWGPMLITRVVSDLQQRGDQLIDLRRVSNRVCADLERTLNQVTDLRERYEKFSDSAIEVLSIITALLAMLSKTVSNNDVTNVNQIAEYLLQTRLENVKDKFTPVPIATWEELYKANILSKNLYQRLQKPG